MSSDDSEFGRHQLNVDSSSTDNTSSSTSTSADDPEPVNDTEPQLPDGSRDTRDSTNGSESEGKSTSSSTSSETTTTQDSDSSGDSKVVADPGVKQSRDPSPEGQGALQGGNPEDLQVGSDGSNRFDSDSSTTDSNDTSNQASTNQASNNQTSTKEESKSFAQTTVRDVRGVDFSELSRAEKGAVVSAATNLATQIQGKGGLGSSPYSFKDVVIKRTDRGYQATIPESEVKAVVAPKIEERLNQQEAVESDRNPFSGDQGPTGRSEFARISSGSYQPINVGTGDVQITGESVNLTDQKVASIKRREALEELNQTTGLNFGAEDVQTVSGGGVALTKAGRQQVQARRQSAQEARAGSARSAQLAAIEQSLESQTGRELELGQQFDTTQAFKRRQLERIATQGGRGVGRADVDGANVTFSPGFVSSLVETQLEQQTGENVTPGEDFSVEQTDTGVKTTISDQFRRSEAAEKLEQQLEQQLGQDLQPGDDFVVKQTDSGFEASLTKSYLAQQAEQRLEQQTGDDLQPGKDFVLTTTPSGFRTRFTEQYREQQADEQVEQTLSNRLNRNVSDEAVSVEEVPFGPAVGQGVFAGAAGVISASGSGRQQVVQLDENLRKTLAIRRTAPIIDEKIERRFGDTFKRGEDYTLTVKGNKVQATFTPTGRGKAKAAAGTGGGFSFGSGGILEPVENAANTVRGAGLDAREAIVESVNVNKLVKGATTAAAVGVATPEPVSTGTGAVALGVIGASAAVGKATNAYLSSQSVDAGEVPIPPGGNFFQEELEPRERLFEKELPIGDPRNPLPTGVKVGTDPSLFTSELSPQSGTIFPGGISTPTDTTVSPFTLGAQQQLQKSKAKRKARQRDRGRTQSTGKNSSVPDRFIPEGPSDIGTGAGWQGIRISRLKERIGEPGETVIERDGFGNLVVPTTTTVSDATDIRKSAESREVGDINNYLDSDFSAVSDADRARKEAESPDVGQAPSQPIISDTDIASVSGGRNDVIQRVKGRQKLRELYEQGSKTRSNQLNRIRSRSRVWPRSFVGSQSDLFSETDIIEQSQTAQRQYQESNLSQPGNRYPNFNINDFGEYSGYGLTTDFAYETQTKDRLRQITRESQDRGVSSNEKGASNTTTGRSALGSGWTNEFIVALALGPGPRQAPSQERLREVSGGSTLSEQLPLQVQLTGTEAEQEAIQSAEDFITFGEFDFGRDASGGFL